MEVVDIEDLDNLAEPEIHEIHGGHKKVRKWIYNPKWEELPEFQKWLTKSQQTSEDTVSFEIFQKRSLFASMAKINIFLLVLANCLKYILHIPLMASLVLHMRQ